MEKTGASRLLQMQARFQQKQMQEREMKIASLYEAQQARALDRVRHSPSNGVNTAKTTSPSTQPPVPMHPGKVRQMFEERRTKGIDKSYPLQPLHNTDRAVPRKATNGFNKASPNTISSSSRLTDKKTVKQSTSTRVTTKKTNHKIENLVNGSGDLNHNHKPDKNMNSIKRELPHNNGDLISNLDDLDGADNNYLLENETFPESLAPLPTPRSPEPKEPKRPPRRSPTNKQTVNQTASIVVTKSQPVAPPRKVTSEKSVPEKSKPRGAMQRGALVKPVQSGTSGYESSPRDRPIRPLNTRSSPRGGTGKTTEQLAPGQAGNGVACAVCGRHFAADRIAKHEEICRRTANAKKRKPFDALKHRLQGTEAEQFIGKIKKQQTTSSTKISSKAINSTWRQKHDDFIKAIRAAKQVQAHLNAGGKLSDLPPPPPSENPDYVQCPHCNRRFNQAAAERHIPKCANFQFNKPKPNGNRKR
ncbi:zinc finger C2HC domain-containing protein 1C isoform X2 [Hyposmocoma kahamanoa]|uniref:zinc finger C2HC domain-containing protein 1C isoform X2 n=1 Tax=Hyposmocoma kahamanoa TaxID=1477025 RepID=UPI000E6D6B13|nr:zinc finger C2HC domain-containing protein 1C isoform X2 [Hyposmocoma kahamanoa]